LNMIEPLQNKTIGTKGAVPKLKTLNGVLNVDKPAGMTSHDVVDRVRNVAGMKRVGHTGTLDPMATGVLPLCLGRATKIAEFLTAQDKEYIVEMQLGIITDSQDVTGAILEEVPIPSISEESVTSIFDRFVGEQFQIPPMVSAKHHKGKRLYELARKGVEVKRDPCKIFIYGLSLLAIRIPHVRFRVICSKGTYIRTLCHDLGQALDSGAAMSNLTRDRCGSFHIDRSVSLDALQTREDIEAALCGMNEALVSLASVMVGTEGKAAIHCGRPLSGGLIARRIGEFLSGDLVRVNARDGALIGIGQALMGSNQLDALAGNLRVIQPVKVFR
jgi:tRNA pseudouridine55 synthase